MSRRSRPGPRRGDRADDDGAGVLAVVAWLGTFAAAWWVLDRLLWYAAAALPAFLGDGARTLRDGRRGIAPVLALALSVLAVALASAWRRRGEGAPGAVRDPQPEPEPPPAPAAPDPAALDRHLAGELRAERSAMRRAVLAVDQRIARAALRRAPGADADIGCAGVMALLALATVALPLVAELAAGALGVQVGGDAAVFLWLAVAYALFAGRAGLRALRARGARRSRR